MKRKLFFTTAVFMLFTGIRTFAQIAVLSGPEQGSYYEFVGDMADMVNTDTIILIVNTMTEGAAMNLDNISDPKSPYKIGLVQEDYLYFMQNRDLIQNTNKLQNIKVVVPLANEEIHLVTNKNSGINSLKDITDSTRIAIGKRSQGTYITANNIKDRSGVFWKSMEVLYQDALRMLLLDQMDAFFVVGSAPMEKLNVNPQALSSGVKLVPLHDFNDWAKYYDEDLIRAGTYKWLEEDVPTFSVKTLLVVNESKLTTQDRKLLDKIITELMQNLENLRLSGHPKWHEVDLTNRNSIDWPLYENK